MIKGILFDMDGVLVDSEEFIFEATKMMFAEHGVTVKPADALHFVGMGENRYIAGQLFRFWILAHGDSEIHACKVNT